MENEDLETNALNKDQPWPGLRVFTEENASFFFGRETEIDDLARMIRQETMTVLFGKSGLGKSSILRAGVSKELAKQDFVPIYIRLNHFDEETTLIAQVKKLIKDTIESRNIDAPLPEEHKSIWEYFHRKEVSWWDEDNNLLKPVLIFDQFEEILTVGQTNSTRMERCREFLSELEKLVENRPPDELLEQFKKEKGSAKNFDLERIDYRVVLSLREDYLADLESLRERLRSIMINRYRLVPMNGKQAKKVIMGPGSHLVDDDVALKIIDFVSLRDMKDGEENDLSHIHHIEPALLSVILRELNNKRIELKEEKISSELITQNKPEEILSSFYHAAMKNMDEKTRDFVEEQLLTSSGARNRVAEEDAVGKFGVSKNTISKLVDRRIIQRDRTGDITWLELNHDILTHVVSSSADNRKRRKRIKKSLLYGTMAVGGVIALLGLGYLNQVEQRARQTEQAASLALDIAEYLEENSDLPALGKYRILQRLDTGFDQLRDFSGDTEKLLIENARFQVTMAETQFETGYFEHATKAAEKANQFIFKDNPNGLSGADPLLKAKIKFKLAQSKFYIGDFKGALEDIKKSEDFLNRISTDETARFFVQRNLDILSADIYQKSGYPSKAQEIINESVRISEEYLTKIKNEDSLLDNKQLQDLYTRIFKLYNIQAGISDQMDLKNTDSIYTRLKNTLDSSEALFKEELKHRWDYFNAQSYEIKANTHIEKGQQSEAQQAQNVAVDILTNLVRANENNLIYRYELSSALVRRARFSNYDAPLQAKHDYKIAEDLANTIRRDTSHPFLSFATGSEVFYRNALVSFGDKRNYEFLKLRSLVDAYTDAFHESNLMDGYHALKIYIELYSRDKSAEQTVELVQKAVDIFDKMEKRGADALYMANRRYYIYQILFQSKNLSSIPESVLKRHYENAIKQVDFLMSANPENTNWIYEKSRFLYLRADYYFAKQDYEQAYAYYLDSVQETLPHADRYIENPYIMRVLLYAFQSMIKSQHKIGNFEKLSEIETYADQVEETIKSVYEAGNAQNTTNDLKGFFEANDIFWGYISRDLRNAYASVVDDEALKNRLKILQQKAESNLAFYKNEGRVYKNTAPSKKLIYPDNVDWKNVGITNSNIGWPSDNVFFTPNSYTFLEDQISDNLKTNLEELAKENENEITNIRYAPLSFYENAGLLSVSSRDANASENVSYFLVNRTNEKLYRLDGTSPPIHLANAEIPLNIKDLASTSSYLRFFGTFVQGEASSSFEIVESINEITWIEGVPLKIKQAVQGTLRPLKVWREEGDDKNWYATATIAYANANAIFYAKFKVEDTGMVTMLNDQLVMRDMPINNFTLSKGTRSGNYTDRIYLDLTENINSSKFYSKGVKIISERIAFLLTLLQEGEKHDAAYRETLLKEVINLHQPNSSTESDGMIFVFAQVISQLKEKGIKLDKELEAYLAQARTKFLESYISRAREKLDTLTGESEDNRELVNDYLSLSFHLLFVRDFDGAVKTSEQGIALDPDYLPLYTNYAHALLFLGREEEALEIYYKYDGETVNDKTWNYYVLDDFKMLRTFGITHPAIDEIIEKLSPSEPTEGAE